MGFTDVSKPVHAFIEKHPEYEDFARAFLTLGATPIFEWCSRQQRIVLDYQQETLVLTAMRVMKTGEYYLLNQLLFFGNQFKIPVVEAKDGTFDINFAENVKTMTDLEGFVIAFEDGNRYKIKCDWYCQLHRVKSAINQEKGVVQLLVENKMDDLKSLLTKEDLKRVEDYEYEFTQNWQFVVGLTEHFMLQLRRNDVTRKQFALEHMPRLENWENRIVFHLWDHPKEGLWKAISDRLKEYMLAHCTKNVKFAELRTTALFTRIPTWHSIMFDTREEVV